MLVFKIFSIVVVLLLAAVIALAATKPDTFWVQRRMITKAPADKVFALINDLHNWGSWSPYEQLDPGMKKTYSSAARGQGAVYEWEGNNKVGKGRMEIVDASLPSRVNIKLDLVKPIEGHNIAELTLQSKEDSTTVIWAMHGPSPYMAKVIGVFFSVWTVCWARNSIPVWST